MKKHNAPDLTLYDMPGMTYSNPNEAKLIREMYIKYLQGNNTIILLVISGTTDVTSSEAISIIKENCKDYIDRTYLIITKADAAVAIDKKFQLKFLNNPLGLKYKPYIVRHRNQMELDEKLSFEDAKIKEMEVLSGSDFDRIPREFRGTNFLIKKLIKVQKDILLYNQRIILKKIENERIILKKNLIKLPKSFENDSDKFEHMKNYFKDIIEKYNRLLLGYKSEYLGINSDFNNELNLIFSQYRKIFKSLLTNFLSENFNTRVKNDSSKISILKLPNLLENLNFNEYILDDILKTYDITYELIDKVKSLSLDYMVKIIESSFSKDFRLRDEIIYMLQKNIEEKKEEIKNFIDELFRLEKDSAFTIDDFYLDTINEVKNIIDIIKKDKWFCDNLSNKEIKINSIDVNCYLLMRSFFLVDNLSFNEISNKEIMISCFSYSNIFQKRFVDYVIKSLVNKFVIFYRGNLGNLLEEKFSPMNKDIFDLIEEDEKVKEEKLNMEIRLNLINNAIEKLISIK